MKISFSTLACPDLTWQEIYSMAKDFGFDGIEMRGLGNDIISYKALPFTDAQIEAGNAGVYLSGPGYPF